MQKRWLGRNLNDRIEMTSLRCAMIFALLWLGFLAYLTACLPDDPPDVEGHKFDHTGYTLGN